jgi:hypothetical protein
MTKQTVIETHQTIDAYTFSGMTLYDFVEFAGSLNGKYSANAKAGQVFFFDVETRTGWDDSNCEFTVVSTRPETDEEYAARIEKEKKRKAAERKAKEKAKKDKQKKTSEQEFAEYLRLKAIYGDKA